MAKGKTSLPAPIERIERRFSLSGGEPVTKGELVDALIGVDEYYRDRLDSLTERIAELDRKLSRSVGVVFGEGK